MNTRLQAFVETGIKDQVSADDVFLVVSIMANLYKLYNGYSFTNDTISSLFNVDDSIKWAFSYKDIKFVLDLFYLVIDQMTDKLVKLLMTDTRDDERLITVDKCIKASALLRKCHYMLIMSCRFDQHIKDVKLILKLLYQAKGHVSSLFLHSVSDNATHIIRSIDSFVAYLSSMQNDKNVTSCYKMVDSHLSVNLSTYSLIVSTETTMQLKNSREKDNVVAKRNMIISILLLLLELIMYLTFLCLYKRKLACVHDLNYCNDLFPIEINEEIEFFSMLLSDIVPQQLFLSPRLSGPNLIRRGPRPRKTQVSFADGARDVTRKTTASSSKDFQMSSDRSSIFSKLSLSSNSFFNNDNDIRPRTRTLSSVKETDSRKESSSSQACGFKIIHHPGMGLSFRCSPYFPEVTVMMIDVVNFNRLLDYLSAEEVVNVVTYMTRLLDDRASYYDVFVASKGTTSFTVISGFAEEQRFYQASHIANMALDVNVSCSDLEINNVPDAKLRLRIGIHTGCTFAAIQAYPRLVFRISGEITRVVRKLQITSFPNKIQISDTTYKLLSRDRAYNFQKRGFIDLKKGKKICTYWLVGKQVSVASMVPLLNKRRHSTIINPIELEQKPLYDFDVDDGIPHPWTYKHLYQPDEALKPHCSYHRPSQSSFRHLELGSNPLIEDTEL